MCGTHARGFCFSDSLNPVFETIWNIGTLIIRLLISIKAVWNTAFKQPLLGCVQPPLHLRRTHFVWDGSRLLQEYTYKGSYTYIYTDQDRYELLAQVFDNAKDGKQYLAYFHNDQIGIPLRKDLIHD